VAASESGYRRGVARLAERLVEANRPAERTAVSNPAEIMVGAEGDDSERLRDRSPMRKISRRMRTIPKSPGRACRGVSKADLERFIRGVYGIFGQEPISGPFANGNDAACAASVRSRNAPLPVRSPQRQHRIAHNTAMRKDRTDSADVRREPDGGIWWATSAARPSFAERGQYRGHPAFEQTSDHGHPCRPPDTDRESFDRAGH
jgi:hypothetical protein